MSSGQPFSHQLRVGDRRPIMALLELLGRRWALRILWELRGGPLTSRVLRTAAGEISPTVLQARVNELRDARILELGDNGYQLTELGRELLKAFSPLYTFADRWASALVGETPTTETVPPPIRDKPSRRRRR